MKKLGASLREARENKGLSIQDVHEQTRIAIDRIEMIEAGEWDALPLTYYRSFVRSLCQLYDLDGDRLLDEWQIREYEEPKVELEEDLRRVSPKNYGAFLKFNHPTVFILAIVSAIVLIVLIGIRINSRHLMESSGTPADSTAVRSDSLMTGKAAAQDEPFEIAVKTEKDLRVLVQLDQEPGMPVQIRKDRVSRWQVRESLRIILKQPEEIEIRRDGRLLDYSIGTGLKTPYLKITRDTIEVQSKN